MKFTLATATVLVATLQASAQTLSSITTTHGGTGCNQSNPPLVVVTNNAIDITPSVAAMTAVTGGSIINTRKNCQVNVAATVSPNWRFRVSESDVPVNTVTPSGNSADVRTTSFFSGLTPQSVATTTLTTTGGTVVNNVLSPNNLWSACGGAIAVNINTQLLALGSASGGSVASAGTIASKLEWEAC